MNRHKRCLGFQFILIPLVEDNSIIKFFDCLRIRSTQSSIIEQRESNNKNCFGWFHLQRQCGYLCGFFPVSWLIDSLKYLDLEDDLMLCIGCLPSANKNNRVVWCYTLRVRRVNRSQKTNASIFTHATWKDQRKMRCQSVVSQWMRGAFRIICG